jgi:transcriptional regulator with XRE-family HTH domain
MAWISIESVLASVGARIRSAREKAGLTQFELAELAGLTRQHLQRIEAGTTNPTIGTLYRLAKRLRLEAIHISWRKK